MENSGDLPREHQDNLAIIKQSAEDLQRIVTAVLDWSKLDAGSIQAESIDFGLRNIVEAAAATVSHIAQAKNIEILIDNSIDTDPTHLLKGDPHRIRQCLLNLLSNACKFIPLNHTAKPVVRIRWSVEEKGDRADITIAVQDEGIGIPRKAMSKLFGAFVQVDNGISRNYGGTGLGKLPVLPLTDRVPESVFSGLSITRGLCRAMGGKRACTLPLDVGRV
jgi:two-component system sensor histidine kinase/response regulator